MRAAKLFLTLPALAVLGLPLHAEDAKNYSYHSTTPSKKAAEVEDIGEIGSSDNHDDEAAEIDGKSDAPPPEPMKKKFRFNVTTRGEYTSNAKLSGNHSSSDFVFLPTIEGGYKTPLGKYFTFDLAAKVESGLYADYGDHAFWGYSANATLDYRPRPNLPRIYVSAEPYRYDSLDTSDMITQAVGMAAGTDWGFSFNGGRSLAFVGYTFTRYIADPSIDDRNSNRVVVGLAHQFRQNLTGQVFYSWQYNDFTSVDRHDSKNMVGANLIYQFNERLFGSVSSSFIDNDSSALAASYQSVTASLGLTLQF